MKMKARGLFACAVLALTSGACSTTYFETPTSATATTTTTTADLWTFASQVARGGFAARGFTLANSGTIHVTLTSLSPSVPIGLGIGIPDSGGGSCSLTRSVETVEGTDPQVSVAVDAGAYCVKVFDMGHIEESAAFTLIIGHP